MAALIPLLLQAIGWVLVPLGWKLLRGLGFTAVAYVGITAAMDQAKNFVFSNIGSVPAAWLEVLGLLKIDVAINILFSAYVARAVLWGVNAAGSKTSIRMGG